MQAHSPTVTILLTITRYCGDLQISITNLANFELLHRADEFLCSAEMSLPIDASVMVTPLWKRVRATEHTSSLQ